MELFGSYTGADFLWFYAGLLVAAAVASLWIPGWLRAEGRFAGTLDTEEAAYLAGGPQMLLMAVLADLYARNAINSVGTNKLSVVRSDAPASPAGQGILRGGGTFDLWSARRRVAPRARQLRGDLSASGLRLNRSEHWALRLWSVSPYLALILLGLYRRQAGEALGEPTGFLTGLLLLTVVLAIIRLTTLAPLTRAGEEALTRQREQSARLRSAPTAGEAGMAVALFGTGVLVGTPFEAVHAMRQASGDSGGGGDSSSGGDSGCGGGGCGGCGG